MKDLAQLERDNYAACINEYNCLVDRVHELEAILHIGLTPYYLNPPISALDALRRRIANLQAQVAQLSDADTDWPIGQPTILGDWIAARSARPSNPFLFA